MSKDLTPEEMDSLSEAMGSMDGSSSDDELAGAVDSSLEDELVGSFSGAEEEDKEILGNSSGLSSAPSISNAQFLQLEENQENDDDDSSPSRSDMERISDVKVRMEVVLGNTKMPLEKVLKLQPGSVVELDKLAGEPVELFINGKLIARAEIVVVEENFGVRVVEITGARHKIKEMQV